MNKNKLWISLAIVFFIFFILPDTASAEEITFPQVIQGQANHNVKFGLRITGGASLLMRNDINDHLESFNEYYGASSYTVGPEFKLTKMGMDLGGEILISFMPNFSLGIGTGYISAGKETTMELSSTSVNVELMYDPKFSAIPITLSFYYGIPVGSSIQVILNAGLGYYIGTVHFDYSTDVDAVSYTAKESITWSAKSNAIGFHGGIDLEFGIAPNLALVVGAKGRYAKLTDLTGTKDYDYSESTGYSLSYTDEDAILWYYLSEDGSNEYPLVALSVAKPTGPYLSDARKAEVNLSGIVFQAGIKITF